MLFFFLLLFFYCFSLVTGGDRENRLDYPRINSRFTHGSVQRCPSVLTRSLCFRSRVLVIGRRYGVGCDRRVAKAVSEWDGSCRGLGTNAVSRRPRIHVLLQWRVGAAWARLGIVFACRCGSGEEAGGSKNGALCFIQNSRRLDRLTKRMHPWARSARCPSAADDGTDFFFFSLTLTARNLARRGRGLVAGPGPPV